MDRAYRAIIIAIVLFIVAYSVTDAGIWHRNFSSINDLFHKLAQVFLILIICLAALMVITIVVICLNDHAKAERERIEKEKEEKAILRQREQEERRSARYYKLMADLREKKSVSSRVSLASQIIKEFPLSSEAKDILEQAEEEYRQVKEEKKEELRRRIKKAKAEGKDICENCGTIEPHYCKEGGECLGCCQDRSPYDAEVCYNCYLIHAD